MGWWGLTFLSADHVPGRGLRALFELSPLNLTVGSWCSDYSHFTCAEKWGVELLSSGPSVTELRKDSKICPHTGLLNTAPLPLDHYTSLERSLEADYVRGISHLRRPPSSPQDLLVMKLLFLAFTHRGLLWACLYHSVRLGVEWGLSSPAQALWKKRVSSRNLWNSKGGSYQRRFGRRFYFTNMNKMCSCWNWQIKSKITPRSFALIRSGTSFLRINEKFWRGLDIVVGTGTWPANKCKFTIYFL